MIGFLNYCELPLYEQKKLQKHDFSNWEGPKQYDDWKVVDEDISNSDKKNQILLLKKLLSNFDKYFHYSDDPRSYRKGKDQQDEIEKLVSEIGKEGKKIYKKFFEQIDSEYKNEKTRSKKEKKDDDELVDVKPKIKEYVDYMNPRNWFPETANVKSTGSLNELKPVGAKGVSYFPDGGNLYENTPKFVPPSSQRIKDLNRQRTI
jgi:hypothetical protein